MVFGNIVGEPIAESELPYGFLEACIVDEVSHLSDEKIQEIYDTYYDGDEAGLNATKKAIDMMRYKANQWVIKMPDGIDPGSCEIQELKRLYEQREKVL